MDGWQHGCSKLPHRNVCSTRPHICHPPARATPPRTCAPLNAIGHLVHIKVLPGDTQEPNLSRPNGLPINVQLRLLLGCCQQPLLAVLLLGLPPPRRPAARDETRQAGGKSISVMTLCRACRPSAVPC